MAREMEMFWFKFNNLTSKDILAFKKVYDLTVETVTDTEKMALREGLLDSNSEKPNFKLEEIDFYKVKFTQVLDIVGKRKCFLSNGYAYVSAHDFGHIIAPKFEKFIERGLEEHAELLPELEYDERIYSIIKDLHTSYSGKDYTVGTNEVAIENLDQLSKKSYPLCMRMCHDSLRATHKLKHNGRMQYQLFLKGIGVTLEDCTRFMREEFTRVVDPDKFDKHYSYNIRHNYGKEGSRVNYAPYSCMKIINQNSVSADDVHGCPFRRYHPTDLKAKLVNYGLATLHAEEVTEYARKGHYQIACQHYFEIVHEAKVQEGINHPNRYFELSQEVMGKRQPKQSANKGGPQAAKARTQDLVLKKKKQQQQLMDEEAELVRVTQLAEEAFTKENIETAVQKEMVKVSDWGDQEDEDDLDMSQIDDAIAMQY